MVSENGYCGHVNGGYPKGCWKDNVTSESICRADCTSNSLCIAYEYDGSFCGMIQSSNICPDNYVLDNDTLAKKASDIVETNFDSFVCYRKQYGNKSEIVRIDII